MGRWREAPEGRPFMGRWREAPEGRPFMGRWREAPEGRPFMGRWREAPEGRAGGATSINLDIPIRFFCIVPVMRRQLGWLGILPALAALTPYETVNAAAPTFMPAMQAASQARQVPLPLGEAITYGNSRWEWIGSPAIDGGVGPMLVMP